MCSESRRPVLVPFAHGNLGMLAGLGHHDGAGRLLGVPVSGFLAWWIVRTYHLLQLPTMSRKVRLNVPRLVKPTSRQMSVIVRSVSRSMNMARSTRRRCR